MKKIILLIALIFSFNGVFAQKDYSKEWKEVEQFELEGKLRSALEVVQKIYTDASSKKNVPQLIKSLLFKSKFILGTEENKQQSILGELQKQIQAQPTPAPALLEYLYANFLRQYLNQNQYKIRQRTKIIGSTTPSNFESWDAQTFAAEIETHLLNALFYEEELKEIDVSDYEALFTSLDKTKKFRPTLYDFLVSETIEFYTNDAYNLMRPNKQFYVDNPDYLGTTTVFSSIRLAESDTLDPTQKSLKLYQEIEVFHQNDVAKDAYLDWVLNRLNFVRSKAITPDKDRLYSDALINLDHVYSNEEPGGLVSYALANFYFNETSYSNAKNDPIKKDYRKLAYDICKSIISKFPNSEGGLMSTILLNKIEQNLVRIKTEAHVLPNQPVLAQIHFQNTDSVDILIYKNPPVYPDGNRIKEDSILRDFVFKHAPVLVKSYNLPEVNRFFEYSTEVIIPPLPLGKYLIVVAPKEFDTDIKTIQYFQTLQATNLSLLSSDLNDKNVYQVLDRNSGKPLQDVFFQFDSKLQENTSGKTNAQGIFTIDKVAKKQKSGNLLVYRNADTLRYDRHTIHFKGSEKDDEEEQKWNAKAFVYLDRSIYRPGQTVYFKGILIQEKKGKSSVVAGVYPNVIIYDANSNEVKTFRLKTNEFGSFSGEFTIPQNVLTGEFSIEVDEDFDYEEDEHPFWDKLDDFETAEVEFSVEEYKRPRFEVNFKPVKESYKTNDTIRVTGIAKAFFGSNITRANIDFVVKRNTNSSVYYRRNYFYADDDFIIMQGQLQSDENGEFVIEFPALPNENISRKDKPVFNYEINAEVTDINGETHTANLTVRVGYHNLEADWVLLSNMDVQKQNSVVFNSKNLNDEPIPAKGKIAIYKLQNPGRVLRSRAFGLPEVYALAKEDFLKNFPNEVYDSLDYKDHWKKGKLVFSSEFESEGSHSIDLKTSGLWESGEYIAEGEVWDVTGDTVKLQKNFSVFNNKDTFLADKQLFFYGTTNTEFKKEGFAELKLSTATDELIVHVNAYYDEKEIFSKIQTIDKGVSYLKIPIKSYYHKKINVRLHYVKFNSFFERTFDINLPEDEKSLNIETLSFRNKLTPGQKETWQFKISGNNDKIAYAEVLASMYDASLDQFVQHNWDTKIDFDRYRYSYTPDLWSLNSFETNVSQKLITYGRNYYLPNVFKDYYRFNLYGMSITISKNAQNDYIRRISQKNENTPKAKGRVSGVVVDSQGLPLPGVSVSVKGTTLGTQTDFDGYYSLDAPAGSELVFSYIGFNTTSVQVGTSTSVNLSLTESQEMLEEVVVTGYGIQTKKSITGAVAVVESEEIEVEAAFALAGFTYGVQILRDSTGAPGAASLIKIRGMASINNDNRPLFIIDGVPFLSESKDISGYLTLNSSDISDISILKGEDATTLYGARAANGVVIITTKKALEEATKVAPRKNLKETAFFYPHLMTGSKGEVSFTFDSPEALTRWKLMLLAHDKSLSTGGLIKEVITQKDLMVIPNPPRFLRENDSIVFSTKINNLTAETRTGTAVLQLFDAQTMEGKNIILGDKSQPFSVASKGNTQVSWTLAIPKGLQGLQYKIIAVAGNFSDGEENVLPVLSNRTLVTEAIPLMVRPGATKTVGFDKLKNNTSATLQNHQLTFEYTSNPAWYAIQSLPYLMEFQHECAEQTFSRFYANAVSESVINSNPKIKDVFDTWRNNDALVSTFEKNSELKSILIAETPWLRDSQSEAEQKNRLSLLFDLEKNRLQKTTILAKLTEMQMESGGFPWFDGGRENEFITRHIVSGFGHLKKLGIKTPEDKDIKTILKKALQFLDSKFVGYYTAEQRPDKKISNFHFDANYIQYLYARSFFLDEFIPDNKTQLAIDYYLEKIEKNWLAYDSYEKAMMVLFLTRTGKKELAEKIWVSLDESAVKSTENGMYWNDNQPGWFWYQAPVERQAVLIEAFTEMGAAVDTVDEMKLWLLKNRQTNSWSNTKSTAEAIYALLRNGSDWLSVQDNTDILIGGEKIKTAKLDATKKEAATGYMKVTWKEPEISPKMASVKVKNKSDVVGFGGFYWQYFEDLDKIGQNEKSPLQITKALYLKQPTGSTSGLYLVDEGTQLKVGDLITVRIEITSQNDMEFLHLKDMRASGLEPLDVLSKYKWQDGLGYYQSTKDVATHFFIDWMSKGTYVFEYDLRVNNAGQFSNGITTIESMYAPEFRSHSQGQRITVD